jgi:ferredoxin
VAVTVRFVDASGENAQEFVSEAGDTLLSVGQAGGMPLEGTCEGQMACSTCHVIVDADWFAKLPRASEEEEDMLDLAACATRYSRLACQVLLTDVLDGLVVHIPPESRNMQGR